MGALSAFTWTSSSAEQTRALGRALGAELQRGDVVGLSGELGAGKTEFSRGVAQGAQVPPGEVASPTFAIVYPYEGRLRLYHADLYRVADVDELYATGLFDLLSSNDGAALIEWVERVPEVLPPDSLHVLLEHVNETSRRLTATASGRTAAALLARWRSRYQAGE